MSASEQISQTQRRSCPATKKRANARVQVRVRAAICTQRSPEHWVAASASSTAIAQFGVSAAAAAALWLLCAVCVPCVCCVCQWWNEREISVDVSLGRNGRVGSGRVPFATNVLPVRL